RSHINLFPTRRSSDLELKNTANVHIVFENQVHPLKFLEDEEEVIYRIVQEATTNSVRHGHADKISIAISKKEEWLTIIVKDNGRSEEHTSELQSRFDL